MKKLAISFALSFLAVLFFPAELTSQPFGEFQKDVLVDVPGYNYDYDLLLGDMLYPANILYITWVNESDSVYTIFLKKLTPGTIDSNFVIASDGIVKSCPEIVYNSSGPGITILWESFEDSYYQIVRRDYADGLLSEQEIIKDSLSVDPQITMNYNHLAWIMDGNLYLKEMETAGSSSILIDTASCSSPVLLPGSNWNGPLLYEKMLNGNRHICLAEYEIYPDSHWVYYQFPEGNCQAPSLGAGWGLAYEIIENEISKIKYAADYNPQANFIISENSSCSYKNPEVFSYPLPTDQDDTPFFVAFDTDSLADNNEVMIKKMYAWPADSTINISDMMGNDLKPKTGIMSYDGTPYVVIVWEHRDDISSTIWMARTVFKPAGDVKENIFDLESFELFQNYPNPFNSSTIIEYALKYGANVNVDVFDILGNKVAALTDGYQFAGTHTVRFEGKNLSSGVYIYSIMVNRIQKTRAMIMLK